MSPGGPDRSNERGGAAPLAPWVGGSQSGQVFAASPGLFLVFTMLGVAIPAPGILLYLEASMDGWPYGGFGFRAPLLLSYPETAYEAFWFLWVALLASSLVLEIWVRNRRGLARIPYRTAIFWTLLTAALLVVEATVVYRLLFPTIW